MRDNPCRPRVFLDGDAFSRPAPLIRCHFHRPLWVPMGQNGAESDKRPLISLKNPPIPKLLTGVRFSSPAPTNHGAVCAGRRGVAISGRKAWTRDRGFFRLLSRSALKNQARG